MRCDLPRASAIGTIALCRLTGSPAEACRERRSTNAAETTAPYGSRFASSGTGGYQVEYWREMMEVVGCCLTWTVDGTLADAQGLADEKAREGAE